MKIIPEHQVAAVRKLLRKGTSHRAISTIVGLSRYSVEQIEKNAHAKDRVRKQPMAGGIYRKCPTRRCETCNAMVTTTPCIACHVSNTPARPFADLEDKSTGFELLPEERERLEQIQPADRVPGAAQPHETCLRAYDVETIYEMLVLTPCAVGV